MTDIEQPNTQFIEGAVGKPARSVRTPKILVIIMALILLISISVAGYYGYNYYKKQSGNNDNNCAKATCKEILSEATTALTSNNTGQQAKVVAKIQQINGYEKQANYLFVVTKYYINISDHVKARMYYEKLKNVYSSKDGYSEIIKSVATSPDGLKPIVEFLERQANDVKKNSFTIPPLKK